MEIEGRNGEKIKRPVDIRKRWIEYIEELYDKEDKPDNIEIEREDEVDDDAIGPDLLDSEIEMSIRELKNGKTPGPDEIPAEFFEEPS